MPSFFMQNNREMYPENFPFKTRRFYRFRGQFYRQLERGILAITPIENSVILPLPGAVLPAIRARIPCHNSRWKLGESAASGGSFTDN